MNTTQDNLPRAIELLKATLEILRKARQGPYVRNVFALTAFYDGVECDGMCLMEDIEAYLEDGE